MAQRLNVLTVLIHVEDAHLDPLKKRRPKRTHYMERHRRSRGLFSAEWSLVVPVAADERSWEETR